MKEQLIRRERAVKKYILIFLILLFGGFFGYWYSATSTSAYKAAIEAIKTSDKVLADVRKIESFGFVPNIISASDKNTSAEYVITVFGEKNPEYGDTDRKVHIALEKTSNGTWEVSYLSISFVGGANGGDDIIILAFLISSVIALIFLFFLFSAYSKNRKLLLNPNTIITKGTIVDVASRIVKHTTPGESNYGVLSTDFDNRAVSHLTEMFVPAIDFIDTKGSTIHLDHNFSSTQKYEKGDSVTVIYNTEAPQDAHLKDFFWFWVHFNSIGFTVLSFLALGTGIVIVTM